MLIVFPYICFLWMAVNKKSTELVEIRCFRFALPQGLEPWTL